MRWHIRAEVSYTEKKMMQLYLLGTINHSNYEYKYSDAFTMPLTADYSELLLVLHYQPLIRSCHSFLLAAYHLHIACPNCSVMVGIMLDIVLTEPWSVKDTLNVGERL